jgi:ribosome-associated toxin RatA of RatAB toxin-antitoxin module
MLERLVGGVFSRIANTLIDAFVHRAEALNGAPA